MGTQSGEVDLSPRPSAEELDAHLRGKQGEREVQRQSGGCRREGRRLGVDRQLRRQGSPICGLAGLRRASRQGFQFVPCDLHTQEGRQGRRQRDAGDLPGWQGHDHPGQVDQCKGPDVQQRQGLRKALGSRARCRRSPMKRTLAFALLVLLASGRARAQATNATEREIIKLEQAATDAQFKKDRPALERLLADDYLYTHSNGSVLNKTQEIAESMSSDVQWTDSKLADLKVRIFGDVAVLTGEQTIQGTAKGYVPGPRRITDIFVRRSGRWQWLGGQATLEPTR